jgi:hypothetical protein
MTFEQLMAKAAEEANEHELLVLNVEEIRNYVDSTENQLEDLDSILDWAQGDVHSGKKKVNWILIKVIP